MRILRTSRNAADCLFSTLPKGLRFVAFLFRSGFHISVQKMGNRIAFQLVCAQHDTNTRQFSNAKSGLKVLLSLGNSQRWPGFALPAALMAIAL